MIMVSTDDLVFWATLESSPPFIQPNKVSSAEVGSATCGLGDVVLIGDCKGVVVPDFPECDEATTGVVGAGTGDGPGTGTAGWAGGEGLPSTNSNSDD